MRTEGRGGTIDRMTTKKKTDATDADDTPATAPTEPPADDDTDADDDTQPDGDQPAEPTHTPTDLGVPAERFQ